MKEKRRVINGNIEVSKDGGKTYQILQKATQADIDAYAAHTASKTNSPPVTAKTATAKMSGTPAASGFKKKPIGTSPQGLRQLAKEPIEQMASLPVNADLTPIAKEGELKDVYSPTEVNKSEYLQAKYGTDQALADQVASGKMPASSKYKWDMGDAVGIGLAGLQAGYGLQQLLKDKRPIGQIDPAYNKATEQALMESKYGYSPAQAAMLNGQITQGRVAQVAGINAIAGGNAAVGLNNSRAAINSEVANRLKMASEDERLRMQKTQYANQMVGQRAGMSRQLFQDKMNQFQQNQEAGAGLLGQGLSNLVSASRYSQEKQAQDQINKTMFGYLNNIPG